MNRFLLILLISLLIPTSAFAAGTPPSSFSAARSILSESPSLGNTYVAGFSVVMTAPVAGDFSAAGGSIITAAPIAGDGLLLVGSLSSRAPIAGDLRVAGGNISIEKTIAGDLFALGLSVYDSGRVGGNVFIAALNTVLTSGASGPVTIYGNNISLAGDFAGNVQVVAAGRLTLAPHTTIRGKLSYEAPETANIPASATILDGVEYKNVSYLPDAGTSRVLSFISVGFFLFVRILGALILAGLLAGLFPRLAEVVIDRAYAARLRSILLTTLLGFAVLVATPILFVLLALTFVGMGVALLVFISYALMVLLALLYAGILLGGVVARRYSRRTIVLWHDGALGMLIFSLIALVPFVGLFVILLLSSFSIGALLIIFFNFAFPHEEETPELL